MKALVLYFRNKTVTDSEQFVYPNIESVKVTVERIPNYIYSQGIPKSRFFEEANRVFKYNQKKKNTLRDFFKDKFAMVVDLRNANDNFVHGNGRKLVNTQCGLLEKSNSCKCNV